jgi:nucleotide-binding universal stress UspA family protein
MPGKILVPLDGSKTAEKVLPCARYLANRLKLRLELLMAVDSSEFAANISAESAQLLDRLTAEGLRQGEDYLQTIAETIDDAVEVRCEVQQGRPENVIIDSGELDKTALIAMATHGRSGLNRFLLGSVAEKVLRGAANPLLLVRAGTETAKGALIGFSTIIVALDGSALAERILPLVTDLAKRLTAGILLFRAYHVPYSAYTGDETFYAVNCDEMTASVRAEAGEYIERKAGELRSSGIEKVTCLTKEGLAGDEIIALASQTPDSLIAMCSHGRSGIKRWVLGSVTETVVRHAVDPVLVVRAA